MFYCVFTSLLILFSLNHLVIDFALHFQEYSLQTNAT